MLKLDCSKVALDFWNTLDSKQYRQVGRKVMSLLFNPYPTDSASLIGYPSFLRVDSGEYRIIYKIEHEIIHIILIGRRNDGDVYKQLKRKI